MARRTTEPLSDPSEASPPPAEPRCPNCGSTAAGNFCPQCGQEQISVRLGLRALAREFLDDHVGWSTRVPRTMWPLLVKPGFLTREFVDGRRVRYLSPLRLYLTFSVLFFLVVSNPPSWSLAARRPVVRDVSLDTSSRSDSAAAVRRRAKADSIERAELASLTDTTTLRARVKLRMIRRNSEFARMDKASRKTMLQGGVLREMPKAMFVMLPLFALLLQIVNWRRRRFYAEHLIFALHLHAFAFAMFTLAAISPWPGMRSWLLLVLPIYLALALHRTYGGSVVRIVAKVMLLVGVYTVVLIVAAGIVGLLVFMRG